MGMIAASGLRVYCPHNAQRAGGSMLQYRRAVPIAVAATAAGLGFGTGVAVATNTHTTIGGWYYHGLGDGSDNDAYVHPFSVYPQTNYMIADVWRGSELRVEADGTGTHIHQDKSIPSGEYECQFTSGNAVAVTGGDYHLHNHHSYCF